MDNIDDLLERLEKMKKDKSKKDKIIEAVVEAFIDAENPEKMVKEFFEKVDEFKPLVSLIFDWVLVTVGPEINKILKAMAVGIADQRINTLEFYKSKGLSHEDAMDMILDSSMRIERSLRESSRKK